MEAKKAVSLVLKPEILPSLANILSEAQLQALSAWPVSYGGGQGGYGGGGYSSGGYGGGGYQSGGGYNQGGGGYGQVRSLHVIHH